MSVETAVVPVAGVGSRMMPMTTGIEKCMMPVNTGEGTRPLVDYVVQDCADAGLRRVIFVTTERGRTQLNDFYGEINPTLRRQLMSLGKTDKVEAEEARRASYGLEFEYVIQPPDKYGTTVPIHMAKTALRGEQKFALMGGDDFVYHQDGTSELALAVQGWEASGADHAIMGLPIDRDQATKYGVLQINEGRLIGINEKPPINQVPKDPVVNISRYLLSDVIWEHIEDEMAQERGVGEHYITYPIGAAVEAGQSFHVHTVMGRYLDGGSFDGLSEACAYIKTNPRQG